ncbi:class I SAM-dependent methyltransferase [Nocardiopsis sp. HNM0947]|uniref:Class I SAM-dependent methyltransferase n=1 Tax=Nocardiopsis coralli TaxID=2772213 RepID=A0ABR9P6Q4_9ACTN|nr:class I SAM-dependent methyltransferase [Nocardiopsis coralli]MBE2999528.1 class I SAM-dependent methyltransferase [Nocardiopsis coralli]
MVDAHYSNPDLAALYDVFNAWNCSPQDPFYLDLVMAAGEALDVGCGTGKLHRVAREQGHRGRLVGLDPADAMLEVGRTERADIEWTLGDLVQGPYDGQAGGPFEAEFDLVTMSGHAFQVFLTDEQTAANLAGARRALRPGALLAFETRNPAARAWQRWTPEHERRVQAPDGRQAWSAHTLERVEGDLVTFSTAYGIQGWAEPGHSRSTLRFPEAQAVNALLSGAGFEVQAQYGFWDRTPLTETSPEIITLARAV